MKALTRLGKWSLLVVGCIFFIGASLGCASSFSADDKATIVGVAEKVEALGETVQAMAVAVEKQNEAIQADPSASEDLKKMAADTQKAVEDVKEVAATVTVAASEIKDMEGGNDIWDLVITGAVVGVTLLLGPKAGTLTGNLLRGGKDLLVKGTTPKPKV